MEILNEVESIINKDDHLEQEIDNNQVEDDRKQKQEL